MFTLGHQDTQPWVEVREAGVTNVEDSLILTELDHFKGIVILLRMNGLLLKLGF